MNTTTTDPQFDALVRRLLTLTPEQQRQIVALLCSMLSEARRK